MDRETLRRRGEYLARIRSFLTARGYLEVETPILAPALIPESAIEVFTTRFVSPFRDGRDMYLIPSPEVWMKRLIAQGMGSIFQLTKAFRNAESIGRIHNPEFSILEWYTLGANCLDNIAVTEFLFETLLAADTVFSSLAHSSAERLRPPFRRMTMEEAFREYAGFSLAACGIEDLHRHARELGIRVEAGDTWEAAFNRIFVSRVEPSLPADKPLVLLDYPAEIRCLAKRIPGTPWRERWELYVDGIETANCFTEETDPAEVEGYFRVERELKRGALVPHPSDEDFIRLYRGAFPPCSGAALGIDRLLMAFFGFSHIGGVILFPLVDILSP
jgi:lysyl-tRNA synthetase class 2